MTNQESLLTITIASKKSRNIEYIYSYMLYQYDYKFLEHLSQVQKL